jgi:5-amino-6-(5-phospho-D-ribitylamino)uracil phosphatase
MNQMKTLYISDLDGTLLNKSAEISEFTETSLCRLIENGVNFSVATARTAATTLQMVSGIPINIPVILMNGASIYDVQNSTYVKTYFIEQQSVKQLFSAIKQHNVTGFVYVVEYNTLSTWYERINSDHTRRFVEERIQKYGKQFTQIDDFSGLVDKPVLYYSVCDLKEKLVPLQEELCKIDDLHVEFYRDVYEEGYWYLEACSVHASKYNAVNFLREEYGFDKVVSFGDNLNDLPMFLASDESYAVANAKPEVKEKATSVILGNDEDGVVKWLLERFQL